MNTEILNKVKTINLNGDEIKLWKENGANEKILNKRKIELEKFVSIISNERAKSKRRVKPKFEFESITIEEKIAPDNKKVMTISEEIFNKSYIHTSGIMMWKNGGGGIFYFDKPTKNIKLNWINNKELEIFHEKGIVFTKKEEKSFFCGDEVKIIYKEIEKNAL